MNRLIEGRWEHLKGKMKMHWAKLTADHAATNDGKCVAIKGQVHTTATNDDSMIKEEILSRRTLLRGALVVGCGLWMPIIFSGCDANKGSNSSNPAATNSTNSTNSAAPAATGKAPQTSVQYQSQPKGEQKCSECMHFIAQFNSCKLVEGEINPDGWCSLWTKKA